MGRRRDAVLTFVVGGLAGIAAVVLRPPVTPSAVLVGVFGTLALEAALQSRRARVRTLWEDRTRQTLAVAATLLLVALAVATIGATVLVVVCSGVVTYLLVLAAIELRDRVTRRR